MTLRKALFIMTLGVTLPLLAQGAPLAPRIETYKSVGTVALKAHILQPPQASPTPRPAIVLFHGGGWSVGEPEWMYGTGRRFAQLGMVAVAVQYRLSDQKTVTPLEAMEDARDAIRWVRAQAGTLGIDPQRIAAYGVSAGGHLAMAAATLGRGEGAQADLSAVPNALVLVSPAVAIAQSGWVRRILLGRARPEEISPDQFLRAGLPPTLISQGEEDNVTPFMGAFRFSQRMKELGNVCEIKQYAGLGHLLSRKLDEQESEFDPDPKAVAESNRAQEHFLHKLGFITTSLPPAVEGPETVVRGFVRALNAQDPASLGPRLAEKAQWFDVQGEQTRPAAHGRKAVLERFKGSFLDKVELNMLATNGPFVSVRERILRTDAQGKVSTRNALVLYEVAEGQILRVWRYPEQN